LSFVIYSKFIQIKYFGVVNIVSIYLNLINSVGLIMIFTDSWKHSK